MGLWSATVWDTKDLEEPPFKEAWGGKSVLKFVSSMLLVCAIFRLFAPFYELQILMKAKRSRKK